ncbi:MAG: hypothetical protein AAGM04_03685 [Pseudomonadota bacterium]
MRAQFRYSQTSLRTVIITALGLTAIVCFLIWLFLRLFVVREALLITAVCGVIFFAFCSAAVLWRYLFNEVVVAARPDGLLYAPFQAEAIAWDDIKELRLLQAEQEFQLAVYLWRPQRKSGSRAQGSHAVGSKSQPDAASAKPGFVMDLANLDGDVETVLQSIAAYKPILVEQG